MKTLCNRAPFLRKHKHNLCPLSRHIRRAAAFACLQNIAFNNSAALHRVLHSGWVHPCRKACWDASSSSSFLYPFLPFLFCSSLFLPSSERQVLSFGLWPSKPSPLFCTGLPYIFLLHPSSAAPWIILPHPPIHLFLYFPTSTYLFPSISFCSSICHLRCSLFYINNPMFLIPICHSASLLNCLPPLGLFSIDLQQGRSGLEGHGEGDAICVPPGTGESPGFVRRLSRAHTHMAGWTNASSAPAGFNSLYSWNLLTA